MRFNTPTLASGYGDYTFNNTFSDFSEMAPLGHLIIPFRNLPKILKDRYTKEDNIMSHSRSIDMAMQKQYARELMRFIDKSPSVYHVI